MIERNLKMIIKVKVLPGSKKSHIEKIGEDKFVLNVKKKPIEGEANIEAIEMLKEHFKISKSQIRLIRGFKTRNKIFEIIEK